MRVQTLSFPILLTLTTGAAMPRPVPATPTAPDFSPNAFFEGDTVGDGRLKIDFMPVRRVGVVGHGIVAPDGTLVLVQRVREGTKPERTRTWHIRPLGDGRYTGTLSDAKGPVTVTVHGDRLAIAYRMKGGFAVRQSLRLQPGGQVAFNHLVVRKLGVPVAVLRETITRQ